MGNAPHRAYTDTDLERVKHMHRKFRKLDAAEVAELKKYETVPVDDETLAKVAGGDPPGMTTCPWCGTYMSYSMELITGGPDAGRYEVTVHCPQCGYEAWWGDW